MLIEIKRVGVTAKGKDISVGEQVETDENSAKSLIADGYAAEVKAAVAENALKSFLSTSDNVDDKIPTEDGAVQGDAKNEAIEGQNDGGDTEGNNPAGQEQITKLRDALNDRYKRDDLYVAAKQMGVEIAFDAKKAEIVDAVIMAGKAEVLLAQ